MNTLHITYCSGDKHPVTEGTPRELYNSQRITDFIKHCETKHQNWAILSAKYGLFFPEEKHKNYNVTFKTVAYKCRIVENNEILSGIESQKGISQIVNQVRQRLLERDIKRVIFFYEQPLQRRKCYLSILHASADSCEIEHSTCRELTQHINSMFACGKGKIQTSDSL